MNFLLLIAFLNRQLGLSSTLVSFTGSDLVAFAVFSAFTISSALAIDSTIQIPRNASQRQTALVSAFSRHACLLINQSHRLACEYPVKYLSGLLQSGVMTALNISIHGSSLMILCVTIEPLG
jgi:hypothetical protein